MAEKKTKQQPSGRKKFKDEQKEKRIHEHLTDKEDIITEQDIRNIRTDITAEKDLLPANQKNSANC